MAAFTPQTAKPNRSPKFSPEASRSKGRGAFVVFSFQVHPHSPTFGDPWPLRPIPHQLPGQRAIAAYLDALVEKVEEAVERLREYRAAPITAAVTGRIDVRKAAA